MNNMKKIGLSALAALVSSSAIAGDNYVWRSTIGVTGEDNSK